MNTLSQIVCMVAFLSPVNLNAHAAEPAVPDMTKYHLKAVRPVVGLGTSRALTGASLVAQYSRAGDRAAAFVRTVDQLGPIQRGLGFAGASTPSDVEALRAGLLLAALPLLMNKGGASQVRAETELKAFVANAAGLARPVRELIMVVVDGQGKKVGSERHMDLLAAAADGIDGEAVRLHGYLTVGMWAGMSSVVSFDGPHPALARAGESLASLLESDASMVGSDRTVAEDVRKIALQLRAELPSTNEVLDGVSRIARVGPDTQPHRGLP